MPKLVSKMATIDWKQTVYGKRLQQERAIADCKALLGSELVADLIDDVESLVDTISKGVQSSEAVTKAYIAR